MVQRLHFFWVWLMLNFNCGKLLEKGGIQVKKKLLAIFLSFLMVLNILIPTMSYAAEDSSSDKTSQKLILI